MRHFKHSRRRAALILASSVIALAVSAQAALAQDSGAAPAPAPTEAPAAEASPPTDPRNTIIVIGNRAIIALLKDVLVERTYDEDDVAVYGNTVGEVLGALSDDNGDRDPSILVNGRPVADTSGISDLPVEAISRIEVLPQGTASRVGGVTGQRAYNVVLRNSLKSATVTARNETATEGGWNNLRGEALFTYIRGQDRLNLTLREARSDVLLESERNILPTAEFTPFAPSGNIIPLFGPEIDPALSALVGQPVSVLALPGGARPTNAQLIAGANRTNPSLQSQYRSLRSAARPYEIALAGNKELAPGLSLAVNGRLNWTENQSLSGLPSARFTLPVSNLFTPFTTTTVLALNDPSRPLGYRSNSQSQSLSATLNAIFGSWHGSLTARWDRRESTYRSQSTGSLGTAATIADSVDPFSNNFAATIPVRERTSTSTYRSAQIGGEIQGPLPALWAGPLALRGGFNANWIKYDAQDTLGPRLFERHEYELKAGLTIPLTSKAAGFLPILGDSAIDLDIGFIDLGRYGTLDRRSIAFNWQIAAWLRFIASDLREERALPPELIASPLVVTPNVPYFDPLTGQTVEVTTIYGGAAALLNEDARSRTFGLTLSPYKPYNLQFDLNYSINDLRNQIGSLPSPSTAVVAAFPDRFVRDSSGTLVVVDSRSVSFARQYSRQLRLGVQFAIPLSQIGVGLPPRDASGFRRRVPPWRLQVNAAHTIQLESSVVIRAGLPTIDLLGGGALGFGGGQTRNSTTASASVAAGNTGVRLQLRRRGGSSVVIGTLAAPDLLSYAPLTTLDADVFVDLSRLFPKARIARNAKLTVGFTNLTNSRLGVTNQAGVAPQAYQPVRLDPIGRVLMVELRKVF